jgi:hypothetical protein
MRKIHVLLTGLSLVIVALSVNRLSGLTENRLEPHGFLRWLDFNAMLPIPIASVVLYYLLKKDIEVSGEAPTTRLLRVLNVGFLVGIYLLGASSRP